MPNYVYSVSLAKFAKKMLFNENECNISISDMIKIRKEDFEKA